MSDTKLKKELEELKRLLSETCEWIESVYDGNAYREEPREIYLADDLPNVDKWWQLQKQEQKQEQQKQVMKFKTLEEARQADPMIALSKRLNGEPEKAKKKSKA